MQKAEGIVKIPSHHSVDETVDKLRAILQSRGVMLFALIDDSGEAEKARLKMPPVISCDGPPNRSSPSQWAPSSWSREGLDRGRNDRRA